MEIRRIFVFALLLRLLIAPLFYHPDIKSQHFHFQFLSKGTLNIYQYIKDNQPQLPYRDTFNYPPLTYLAFGVEQIILKPILPADFSNWINDWGGWQDKYPNLFYYMLILKLPYMFFDLGIAYFLYKMYGQKLLKLWLFNPFTLYLIYILANFDIVPVFFSVLSFYLLTKSKEKAAFLSLGVAVALKAYPVLFFPFFIFYRPTSFKKIIINSLYFAAPIILSVFPYLLSPAFLQSFSGSGLTQKIIELKIFGIPVYPMIYFIVLFKYLLSKQKNISQSFLILFLAFIVFVKFHPQWLLWFLPFLLPQISQDTIKKLLFCLVIIFSLFYVLLFNDRYLVWGHLIPINPSYILLSHPYLIITHRSNLIPETIQIYIKYALVLLSIPILITKHDKKH